ncbi:NAD(P)H-hydrate epimerase [Enterobacter soli]
MPTSAPVVALDIPSGLNRAKPGPTPGAVIHASHTVTFNRPQNLVC